MDKNITRWRHSFLPAMVVYMAGAIILFFPFRARLSGWDLLLPVNSVAGGLGVWFFSQRWIGSSSGKLAAGAIYGLGPFMLYCLRFHPLAGTIVASVPWSFWPAAFLPARWVTRPRHRAALTTVLMVLPFAVILSFSILMASIRRFLIPLYGAGLVWQDTGAFFFPFASVSGGRLLWGCYHLALAPLLLGLGMIVNARRWMIVVPTVAATVLSCLPPVWYVSPLLWLAIPHVLGALAVGIGLEGMVCTGRVDRGWLLAATVVFILLAGTGLILGQPEVAERFGLPAGRGSLYLESTKLYTLGILVLAVMCLATHLRQRLGWLKTSILCGAVAVDIYACARFILGYTLG